MRIEPTPRVTTGSTTRRAAAQRSNATAETRAADSASHLVAIEPVVDTRKAGYARLHRTNAAFLAQLIATRDNMPQTRARRRAEPDEAIAAYRATERQPRYMDAGRVLSISR
ncbi:hypothetical protein [Stappia sp. ES.058]|uniref:hypothetical protein n=1 Tax=Stappia sp. ES.058 TaxID=1881061 RepID=UPI00087D2756|nr:hypothetical protein [Stappia sp. ES.058]SDU39154.1 hypothetical protein SAMN05428979_3422 [Stappia sp. ES.058]